jgi:hypothetical protein
MKTPRRPLFLIALSMILIVCFISIAMSGTVKNRLNFPQDCAQDCGEKYNKMLENCTQSSGDPGGCRGAAVEQYNRCIEKCGGKAGGKKGGNIGGNSNKQPE